jgi:hypothetical protein
MLLYITAEDVFGDGAPERKGPRPLHRIPDTVVGLYDLGLRHHVRTAVMAWPAGEDLERTPDWKLDRLAIRVALYGREKLGVEPGARVAVFGRLGWLWPVVDFAAMGFGAVPVGLEHDLTDDALRQALAEARPRVVFATDSESAERLLVLHRQGATGEATVAAEGLAEGERVLPLDRLLELGSVMDTAERAQSFRAVSRQIEPAGTALWHGGHHGVVRLSHADAMRTIAPALRALPAQEGDVAGVAGPRVDLALRLRLAAFVGDGHTTTVLGLAGPNALATLRPHKLIVPNDWIERACEGKGPRLPAGLDRPFVRRRLLERLGDRLRWVETPSPVTERTARALDAVGVGRVVTAGAKGQDSEAQTVH